jgi:UPF0755 protein
MDYNSFLRSSLQLDEDEVIYNIASGTSMKSLAQDLHNKGIIDKPRYLEWHARFTNKAQRLHTGEFSLSKEITPVQLMDNIVNGKVVQHSLTIIEGWNIWELLDAVKNTEALEHTLDYDKPENILDQIMAQLGQSGEHPEGQFFPDTYHFPSGTTDIAFLKRAFESLENYINKQWPNRELNLPINSPYEALILASIVEKETAVPEERTKIAGVFTRRLQKSMRLQTDPTVIYGLGQKFDGNIKKIHLKQDNPYNTYRRKGLPPTPIAMPSGEAIYAVLHPAEGDELYFVSKGDGSHHFSSTLKEHNNAVIKYQLKGKPRSFSSHKHKKNG